MRPTAALWQQSGHIAPSTRPSVVRTVAEGVARLCAAPSPLSIVAPSLAAGAPGRARQPAVLLSRVWAQARCSASIHLPAHLITAATYRTAVLSQPSVGLRPLSVGSVWKTTARGFTTWRRTMSGDSEGQGSAKRRWSSAARASVRVAIVGAHLQAALALANHVKCDGASVQSNFFSSWSRGASPSATKASGEAEAAQSESVLTMVPVRLRLDVAVACQGKPEETSQSSRGSQKQPPAPPAELPPHKRCDCGEDAFFIAETRKTSFIGVADGVGGWRQLDIDPSEFAWALMINCETAALERDDATPKEIMATAYNKLLKDKKVKAGSSTAVVLAVDKASGIATAANLGDSGFIVLRDGVVFGETAEQQHYFNCPYQLSVPMKNSIRDSVAMADSYRFQLRAGDIVIMATDGLFDNMFSGEVEEVVNHVTDQGGSLQDVADAILARALAFSHDASRMSPYARESLRNKIFYVGGKVDDITVMVARVVPDVPDAVPASHKK